MLIWTSSLPLNEKLDPCWTLSEWAGAISTNFLEGVYRVPLCWRNPAKLRRMWVHGDRQAGITIFCIDYLRAAEADNAKKAVCPWNRGGDWLEMFGVVATRRIRITVLDVARRTVCGWSTCMLDGADLFALCLKLYFDYLNLANMLLICGFVVFLSWNCYVRNAMSIHIVGLRSTIHYKLIFSICSEMYF